MKKYVFYKITSPIGKVYIGKTTQFPKRMYRHKNGYLKEGRKSYTHLELSFKEFGFDSHLIEKINICICNKEFSDYLEEHYIRLYCSFSKWSEKGLNRTTGGESEIKQCERKKVQKEYSIECRKIHSENISSLLKTESFIKKVNESIEKRKKNGYYKKLAEFNKLNANRYRCILDNNCYSISEISEIEKKVDSGIQYHFKRYGHYKNIYFKELS